MKRTLMTIIAILTIAVSARAMSYEQARREALFLTDKMAYELNLNDRQYDAAYEINLDYLMSIASRDDLYGVYWTRRNTDFGHILLDWQWNAFCAATYFYRPLYWNAGYWHFGIYARYPRRDYFYFSRPTVYVSYRGGHSWHNNGGRSYYHGHKQEFSHNTASHQGMRDRWNNGELRHNNNNRHSGSSTHVTVNNRGNRSENKATMNNDNRQFGGSRSTTVNRNTVTDNGKRATETEHRTVTTERNNRNVTTARPSQSNRTGSFSMSNRNNGARIGTPSSTHTGTRPVRISGNTGNRAAGSSSKSTSKFGGRR